MVRTLNIGHLVSGGIVLGYRCQSACRHCLYGSGPHRHDGKPTADQLEQLLDLLTHRAQATRFHIGGGEPFLDIALLKQTIHGMNKRGLFLEYVETNAGWVKNAAQAEDTLSALAAVGLDCVLVSLSPFHAEHVQRKKVHILLNAAESVLARGAFAWMETFEKDLSREDENNKLDFNQFLGKRNPAYASQLAARYGLVPGGRTARYLFEHGHSIPTAEAVKNAPCAHRLRDTTHFHVDGDGLYVPGLCAGLVLPMGLIPGEIDLTPFPVIRTLLEPEGLAKLVKKARAAGFTPHEGYSSPCDICNHVRYFLSSHDRSADLGPVGYYHAKSIPGYGITHLRDNRAP